MVSVKKFQSGYIALMSVVLVSTMLLMIALENSKGAFFVRFAVFGEEQKLISRSLAYSCTRLGILSVREDKYYSGQETLNLTDGDCQIGYVRRTEVAAMFFAAAEFMGAYTGLDIEVNLLDGSAIITP